ncbi:FAD-dependent monooxygenase [Limnohabitans sp. WS1]|uniref:FAD-dependent monooxygenase n=1 Tax=Limnohabitans sp. WS1 TaxID=1100726 RepID=UPI000D394AD9|nr:FAD-dependent monooxygenase [Limnohabitans sp. WS1]PUE17926.1 FAD-dependent oxidoreductase [Limnohabitans sp. WS1]
MSIIDREKLVVVGGGIGGLATAIACIQKGMAIQLIERTPQYSHVGAGIQLGPNVTRILQAWGLGDALAKVAAYPKQLQARDARSGKVLGTLPLAGRAETLYGAPYVTVHRADLHRVLHKGAQVDGVGLWLGQNIRGWYEKPERVYVQTDGPQSIYASALIAADGLWSVLRRQMLVTDRPSFSGHLAYRAMVSQADLPAHLRSDQVTVWMGHRLHVVHYPVRGGESLNLVAIVHGKKPEQFQNWDQDADTRELMQSMGKVGRDLHERLASVPAWRKWALHNSPPLSSASEMVQGRVALLGDAAHAMLPYLAQGAGMAIEDAHVVAQCLSTDGQTVQEQLQAYAEQRWERNARVQARAVRNGQIFHARGLEAIGRNLTMRFMGERVMDVPWLYGEGPNP